MGTSRTQKKEIFSKAKLTEEQLQAASAEVVMAEIYNLIRISNEKIQKRCAEARNQLAMQKEVDSSLKIEPILLELEKTESEFKEKFGVLITLLNQFVTKSQTREELQFYCQEFEKHCNRLFPQEENEDFLEEISFKINLYKNKRLPQLESLPLKPDIPSKSTLGTQIINFGKRHAEKILGVITIGLCFVISPIPVLITAFLLYGILAAVRWDERRIAKKQNEMINKRKNYSGLFPQKSADDVSQGREEPTYDLFHEKGIASPLTKSSLTESTPSLPRSPTSMPSLDARSLEANASIEEEPKPSREGKQLKG